MRRCDAWPGLRRTWASFLLGLCSVPFGAICGQRFCPDEKPHPLSCSRPRIVAHSAPSVLLPPPTSGHCQLVFPKPGPRGALEAERDSVTAASPAAQVWAAGRIGILSWGGLEEGRSSPQPDAVWPSQCPHSAAALGQREAGHPPTREST